METSNFLEGLDDHTPAFTPEPWYNKWGDCIEYQIADEAIVAERVDEVLTVYNSAVDNRPIGFQIKDVAAIAQRLGCDSLVLSSKVDDSGRELVSISVLLFAAYEDGPKTVDRRKAYSMASAFPLDGKGIPAEEIRA
jgi:hypothetical protein